MENNGKSYKWYIYKTLYTGRWAVWSTPWGMMADRPKFDTWQEAMDYVTRQVELSFDPLIESRS
jgi:hypothetical protein